VLDVYTEFYLVSPYDQSLYVVYEMARLWSMRIINSSTKKRKTVVKMPGSVFKYLFKREPKIGSNYDLPSGTDSFLEEVKVIDIKGESLKIAKQEPPEKGEEVNGPVRDTRKQVKRKRSGLY